MGFNPEEELKSLRTPLPPTRDEQAVLDILNQHNAGSKVTKAGGGQLLVDQAWSGADVITVKTVLQSTGKGEKVREAMEEISEVFEKHGMSCTVETDFNRCNCPQRVILTCTPPQSAR